MSNTFVVTPYTAAGPSEEEINRMLGIVPVTQTTPAIQQPLSQVAAQPEPPFISAFTIQDPHPDNHQHDHGLPDHEAAREETPEHDPDAIGHHPDFIDDEDDEVPGFIPGLMFSVMPEKEFARQMGFTLQTIAAWRKAGKGPRYTMIGKQIFYQEKEIQAWLDLHTRASGT